MTAWVRYFFSNIFFLGNRAQADLAQAPRGIFLPLCSGEAFSILRLLVALLDNSDLTLQHGRLRAATLQRTPHAIVSATVHILFFGTQGPIWQWRTQLGQWAAPPSLPATKRERPSPPTALLRAATHATKHSQPHGP